MQEASLATNLWNKTVDYLQLSQQFDLLFSECLVTGITKETILPDLLNRWKECWLALKREALFDPLTGLLNRRGIRDCYQKLIDREENGTILFLDVHQFKEVNDQLGHLAGDMALTEIARLLMEDFCNQGFSGRFGGDEFIVLFPNCGEKEVHDKVPEFRRRLRSYFAGRSVAEANLDINRGIAPINPNLTLEQSLPMLGSPVCPYLAPGGNRL